MDRISEVLFGLIMALTFTLTFAVATADNMAVRTMLFAALGCNLAWGIIDGGVYLLARLNSQGRAILRWRAVRDAPDAGTAQRLDRGCTATAARLDRRTRPPRNDAAEGAVSCRSLHDQG